MNSPAPRLDRNGIAALVPHSGSMCLLEELLEWDAQRIRCATSTHRSADHPLRSASGLLAPCAIEYGAQAMALHGALLARAEKSWARPGYLASARGVTLHRLRLDDLDGPLEVSAERLAGDGQQILYTFAVTHCGTPVAEGRVAVVLNSPPIQP